MSGQKNWEIDHNASFSFTVEYKDADNNVIDLTGSSAKMQVRDATGTKLAFTLTSPGNGILVDGSEGKLTVRMTPAQTSKLFYPKSVYDIMVTDSNSNKIRILGGYISVNRSVTI